MYDLPPQVLRAISMLNAAGHRAYVVGGAVRELLRGKGTVTDFDLTTSARPEETEGVFAGFRLIETGLKHGTVTVLLDAGLWELPLVGVHPNENTATVVLSPDDLERVVREHGGPVERIEL